MMLKAAEEFDKLCAIKDMKKRIEAGVEQFSKGEISAKAIRMLYQILDDGQKISFIELLYNESNPHAEENMRRCPPSILRPPMYNTGSISNKKLCIKLEAYNLLYEYKDSKVQNKFQKVLKVIEKFYKVGIKTTTDALSDLDEKIIKEFLEIAKQKKKHDLSRLNLPTNITFGVELEFVGVPIEILTAGKESSYFLQKNFEPWQVKKDTSVEIEKKMPNGTMRKVENGAECVSPVLSDSEESWSQLERICQYIQFLGGRANRSCGGHIHMNADVLGYDTEAWDNFLALWREAEPLIYLISNRRGENSRKSLGKYAKPIEKEIDAIRRFGGLLGTIKTKEDMISLATQVTRPEPGARYVGVNLQNIYAGKHHKAPTNTIEFRIPNGSVDYDIIRENVLLYGRILRISKLRSVDPTIKQKEWDSYMERGLEEKEKITRFLNLVFDTEKEKQIFAKRWEYNSGSKERVTFYNRSYYRQFYQEKGYQKSKKMIEQIQDVASTVTVEEQASAMEAMMEDLTHNMQEQENNSDER